MKKLLLALVFLSFLNAEITSVDIKKYDFSNSDYVLVDVRMPSEYKATGVVDGAKLIPIIIDNGLYNQDFLKEFSKLGKDTKIAIMCRSGKRSQKAAEILEKEGYKNLLNLDGGMNELLKTGIKLVPFK